MTLPDQVTSPSGDMQIPVVDISDDNKDAPQQLLDAAATYGFIFIQNNDAGIPPPDINRMFTLSRDFFRQPVEVKAQCGISSNKAGKNHGWLDRGDETLDPNGEKRPDVKEAFNMGRPIKGQFDQAIPQSLQSHTGTLVAFQDSCDRVCQHILRHLATALKIDSDWFTSRHDPAKGESGTIFRMLYYPKTDDRDDDGLDIRAGAHSDYGSLTLLFQQRGQPGLEIKTSTGEWAPVPVDPRADKGSIDEDRALPILVNIGDLLEDWTGGLLKSTVHRVIFPRDGTAGDRYSMAYFCHPLDNVVLEPVSSALVEGHSQKTGRAHLRNSKTMTARDHLMNRLAATVKSK